MNTENCNQTLENIRKNFEKQLNYYFRNYKITNKVMYFQLYLECERLVRKLDEDFVIHYSRFKNGRIKKITVHLTENATGIVVDSAIIDPDFVYVTDFFDEKKIYADSERLLLNPKYRLFSELGMGYCYGYKTHMLDATDHLYKKASIKAFGFNIYSNKFTFRVEEDTTKINVIRSVDSIQI